MVVGKKNNLSQTATTNVTLGQTTQAGRQAQHGCVKARQEEKCVKCSNGINSRCQGRVVLPRGACSGFLVWGVQMQKIGM